MQLGFSPYVLFCGAQPSLLLGLCCIRFWWCVFVHTHRHRQDFYCTLHAEEENYPTKEEDNMEKRKDRKKWNSCSQSQLRFKGKKCFFGELLLVCLKSNYRFFVVSTNYDVRTLIKENPSFYQNATMSN